MIKATIRLVFKWTINLPIKLAPVFPESASWRYERCTPNSGDEVLRRQEQRGLTYGFLHEEILPHMLPSPATNIIRQLRLQQPIDMMQILLPRYTQNLLFRHSNLRTARSGEDFRDLIDIEICSECFLHFFLLRRVLPLLYHACGIDGTGRTSYSPCNSQIQKLSPFHLPQIQMVEGEYHTLLKHLVHMPLLLL